MLTAEKAGLIVDHLSKLCPGPDVPGRSGGAGCRTEGSDFKRKPAGGASWAEAAHWAGGGRPAGQPPAVWLCSTAAAQVSAESLINMPWVV